LPHGFCGRRSSISGLLTCSGGAAGQDHSSPNEGSSQRAISNKNGVACDVTQDFHLGRSDAIDYTLAAIYTPDRAVNFDNLLPAGLARYNPARLAR
jgi:hypothetical protein